jgi:hypothetical protein
MDSSIEDLVVFGLVFLASEGIHCLLDIDENGRQTFVLEAQSE